MPLSVGSWIPIYHNVAWAEAYVRIRWHLDPSSRLATIDIGRKVVRLLCPPPFGVGGWELRPHLTRCRPGRALPPYQVAS